MYIYIYMHIYIYICIYVNESIAIIEAFSGKSRAVFTG